MAKPYRSEALAAIHETMEALRDIGAVDKQTMREFDEACLTQCKFSPRRRSKRYACASMSPSRCLPVTSMFPKTLSPTGNVASRSRGGPALRLITLIQKKGLAAIA